MGFPIVIDLRLLTFTEKHTTKKDVEKEHQRLHKRNISHIHSDGSRR